MAPTFGIEESLLDGDGRERWVRTDKVPYRDKDGRVIGIVVMAQDITESRRAEEALCEREELFSAAFEQAPIGIALVSPEGRWLRVSRGRHRSGDSGRPYRRRASEQRLEACVPRGARRRTSSRPPCRSGGDGAPVRQRYGCGVVAGLRNPANKIPGSATCLRPGASARRRPRDRADTRGQIHRHFPPHARESTGAYGLIGLARPPVAL